MSDRHRDLRPAATGRAPSKPLSPFGAWLVEQLRLRQLNPQQFAVRRTVTRTAAGAWKIGTAAKSRAGRRPIALTPATVAALIDHRAIQATRRAVLAAWQDLDLVFDRGDGGRADPTTTRRALARAIAAAGLPPLTPHQLRHTNATILLAADVHPKIVQERLGHSSIAVTLDRYSHASTALQRQATERLAALLSPEPAAARDRAVTATPAAPAKTAT